MTRNQKFRERGLAQVVALHDELDASVRPLVALHTDRLQCRRGCAACCVDDLTIFEVEAERIRAHCSEVLESEPRSAGACAFLSADGACRIYPHRPYVCRTQGLPLRWFSEDAGGATVELRDICTLNEPGTALEALPETSCWLIGPTEGRLGELQSQLDGGEYKRIFLRDLFCESEREAERK